MATEIKAQRGHARLSQSGRQPGEKAALLTGNAASVDEHGSLASTV
ncbi:MAG: hypothetical protein ACRDRY_13330 [Pseudonocardiaceae bacterium]